MRDLKLLKEEHMKLYCDNEAAIDIAHSPVQHDEQNTLKLTRTSSRKT